jgi:hypothetical protein
LLVFGSTGLQYRVSYSLVLLDCSTGFLLFGSTGLQYRVSSRGLQYRVSVSFVLQDCSTGVPFLLFYRTAVQGFLFFGFYRTAVQGFLFFGSIGLQYRVSYSLVLMD